MLNNHPDDITIQNGNTVIRINKDTFRGIIDYDIENDVYSFSYQDQKGNLKNIRVERNTDPDAFAQIKDYMGSLDGGLQGASPSSALDGRPQIKILSDYMEEFLIFSWSGIGVLLIWRSRSRLTSINSILLISTTLTGIYYLAFLNGWLLPLISSLLALLGSAISASLVKKGHIISDL